MSLQNKLYTAQFSHHLMTTVSPHDHGILNSRIFVIFTKLLKKTELPEKFDLPDKRI